MTKDEALKLALEALHGFIPYLPLNDEAQCGLYDKALTAIKEALAQPEQEPVAWVSSEELLVMRGNALGGAKDWRINVGLVKQNGDVGLYITPPQRKPLTDEEIEDIWADCPADWDDKINVLTLARAIEAAHGIKGEA